MTHKDWRVRLDDMVEAIERCLSYIEGYDLARFAADRRTLDAVARNLEIIGEAAGKIPDHITEKHPMIPWQTLSEMRHILIHEYHAVDAGMLYRTVTGDLPPLITLLRAVLDNDAPPTP